MSHHPPRFQSRPGHKKKYSFTGGERDLWENMFPSSGQEKNGSPIAKGWMRKIDPLSLIGKDTPWSLTQKLVQPKV
jgi:hypothetical protein